MRESDVIRIRTICDGKLGAMTSQTSGVVICDSLFILYMPWELD
jgi:hypothetical protein